MTIFQIDAFSFLKKDEVKENGTATENKTTPENGTATENGKATENGTATEKRNAIAIVEFNRLQTVTFLFYKKF